MTLPQVRPAVAADHAAIAALNDEAFGGTWESRLVARLRSEGLVVVELVASDETGRIVGHIMFSRLSVTVDGRSFAAASLAPVSVAVDLQRRGIGALLARAGIEQARQAGIAAIIVLGHPGYYPRFGFSADRARHLEAPFSGPAFMALELAPGALDGAAGQVTYPAAFFDLTP